MKPVRRKAPKNHLPKKLTAKKSAARTAKEHARTSRKEQHKALRFLVGDMSATRQTLSRVAKGYYDGFVSEREARTLCYLLSAIGKMFVTEMELDVEARLSALEALEKNRGHA